MTAPPGKPNEVAAAKLRLIEAARAFAPLDLVREHPWQSAAVAGAAGALLGASGETLRSAAATARALTGLVGSVAAMADKIGAGARQADVAATSQGEDAGQAGPPNTEN